jgi:hypothetical protein
MVDQSLPSWITPEFIVIVAGLVVAIVACLIAYRELKPGLRVRVVRCTHKVRYAGPRRSGNLAGTELVASFEIGNTGGRTSVYEIELKCKPMGQEYRNTERVQPTIIIDKGDTTSYDHQFYIPKREVSENLFKCSFLLHHTHGKKKVKAKSNLRER